MLPYSGEIYRELDMTPEQEICIACQECCKWSTFTITPQTSERGHYIKYFKAKGFKVVFPPNVDGNIHNPDRRIHIMVPLVCPHLTPFGCDDYHHRPFLCKVYDGRTDYLLDCKLREI